MEKDMVDDIVVGVGCWRDVDGLSREIEDGQKFVEGGR
jgi:hypothetical protein